MISFIFLEPEGLKPPSLLSSTPTSILIVWSAPENPNGAIISYTVERRAEVNDTLGEIVQVTTLEPTAVLRYDDASEDIHPYSTYHYRVAVNSDGGIAYTDWAQVKTLSASKSIFCEQIERNEKMKKIV